KQEAVTIAEIQKAKEVSLAEANRDQVSGIAIAQSIRDSKVAAAQSDRDISVANSQASGEIGKIEANKKITMSQAELGVIEAEATGRTESANEKALAEIQKNKELANKEAEDAKALRTEAALKATTIVPA